MQVQGIKQAKIDNTQFPYSNKNINIGSNNYNQIPYKFSSSITKKEVSFKADWHSIEHYAKKYLYVDNFKSLLEKDIWE